jgi:hypothetical protein
MRQITLNIRSEKPYLVEQFLVNSHCLRKPAGFGEMIAPCPEYFIRRTVRSDALSRILTDRLQ